MILKASQARDGLYIFMNFTRISANFSVTVSVRPWFFEFVIAGRGERPLAQTLIPGYCSYT
jgi:hypothetical protein